MAGSLTPPHEPSSPIDGGIRKRVCKACDRCRLKKSKCDGASPCSRCKADNAICFFGERKKSHDKVYPKGYVEMLENQQSQLVSGIQELYRRLQSGQGWTGSPLKETSTGSPLTHDILERLGALKQDGHTSNEVFEENLDVLQQKLIASGAGFMQREASFDTNSEIDQSNYYEHPHQRNNSMFNQYSFQPPTPPLQSPYPPRTHNTSPLKSHFESDTVHIPPPSEWPQSMNGIMDLTAYDTMPDMTMADYDTTMYLTQGNVDPSMIMKDWSPYGFSKYDNNNNLTV